MFKNYHKQEVVSTEVNEEIVPEDEVVDVEPETNPDCGEDLVEIDCIRPKNPLITSL